MHVLLIEDDVLLGQAIETALARWGHTYIWMRDGRAALSATQPPAGFDVALLDPGLPHVEGLHVLAAFSVHR